VSDLLTSSPGLFSALELAFARSVARLSRDDSVELSLAAAATLRAVTRGDLCYLLGDPLVIDAPVKDDEAPALVEPSRLPDAQRWADVLERSPAVECSSSYQAPTSPRPLVLDARGRVYLRRTFAAQAGVAAAVSQRLRMSREPDESLLDAGLGRLFSRVSEGDLQRAAAALAVRCSLSLITGGPGTGKTTTVAKVLALLVEQALAKGERAPRVALSAPTGKAAARLAQAITRARGELPVSAEVREAIPTSAGTLHRLLGLAPGMRRRLSEGRLSHDVVIVDEASMVDLGLMAELLRALSPRSRLVLLGDPSQLASVAEGAVFADLCAAPAGSTLGRAQVRLLEGHRYVSGSALDELAEAIRAGDAEGALESLQTGDALALFGAVSGRRLSAEFLAVVEEGYAAFLDVESPREHLDAFERFRVLCAHRRGPSGAPEISRRLQAALFERRLLPRASDGAAAFEPILVVRNAPALGLFNGDVGYVDRTRPGASVAYFRGAAGGVRSLAPSRLPAHEPAWAMTIHKSQGSEVDSVALVLPATRSAVCTRELVYTGVTRARSRVDVFSSALVLRESIANPSRRRSGLSDALAACGIS